MIYAHRLEEKTEKKLREQAELRRFFRRVGMILLLSIVVLALLMMTFTPTLVDNAASAVAQLFADGFKAARPVISHAAVDAQALKPAAQHLLQAARSAANP